jgi:gliding motility-associated-like protein
LWDNYLSLKCNLNRNQLVNNGNNQNEIFRMKHFALCIAFAFLGTSVGFSQFYEMENGTINACGGEFTDDGGAGNYTDTPYTMTICPDNPGDVISLTFNGFNLQTSPGQGNSDYLTIYDGDNTSATSLGTYTGLVSGLTAIGTIYNTTGCLTIVFQPNGPANVNSPGWTAEIECVTPCSVPVMNSAITNPLPTGTVQSVGVCIDEPVSFSGVGSIADQGFTLVDYVWDFDDGTAGNGINVTHSFSEPGEYIVQLTVVDNNGCTNNNVIPLQVLVSTVPIFAGIDQVETAYCLGTDIVLDAGEVISTTWTALPPQMVAGTTYLADGTGFTYSSSIVFDFFEPGQLLTTCNDFYGVYVNMEHSYMGDLGISITCPDGTVVNLVTYPNGGGNTFLGEPVDDIFTNPTLNLTQGVGYDYVWSPTATLGTWGQESNNAPSVTYTNALGAEVTNDILPPGTYSAVGNLCDLVGCPLNGAWTFSVTDFLGSDNGYVFAWGIDLNPALFPGVTTFTPIYGADADSTWWEGPHIGQLSSNADIATLNITTPGSYDYTYYATNNFGCTFDTTITVTVEIAPSVTAGPDMLYTCGNIQLQGSFVGMSPPLCSNDAGDYTYCYTNNQDQFFTYCPNTPGDGTMMSVSFTAGSVENTFDAFWVYDGNSISAPLLAGPIYGSLAGLTFTATNPNGCITFGVTPDGSVSCDSGSPMQWAYTIECTTGGPPYTWEWSPNTALNSVNLQNPTLSNLTETTTYTLVGYPVGHPGCSTTDQVTINVDPMASPGLDTQLNLCSTDAPFFMTAALNGNPVDFGIWYDALGTEITDGMFNPAVMMAGNYRHVVASGDCSLEAVLTINIAHPTQITIPNDTILCTGGTVNLNLESIFFGKEPFSYTWTYNGQVIGTTPSMSYQPIMSGDAVLTVTDACNYTIDKTMYVEVLPVITVSFTADTTAGCWPATFMLTNTASTSGSTPSPIYSQSHWQLSDGTEYFNVDQVEHYFENPGTYSVQLTLTNVAGCTYTATYDNYITVHAPPVASFDYTPQPVDAMDTEVHFQNLSTGDIQIYNWVFGQSPVLGTSNQANPVFDFPLGIGGEYPIQLTVRTFNNCTHTITETLVVNDIFQIFTPTAFTPNGDNINDVFMISGSDIDEKRFHFIVFDRWGNVVFETRDMHEAWTGEVNDGEYFAPNGVYNWKSVFISKSTGDRKDLTGSVLLMR